jgi:hypothetical protein
VQTASAFDLTGFLFNREEVVGTVSLISTLARGARVGGATGLSAGWARYADDNNTPQILSSTGIGILAGLGLGLTGELLGKRVPTNRAFSDISYGSRLGGSAGVLLGTVDGLLSGKTERIARDTAWGQLAGVALGVLYAGYQVASGGYTQGQKSLPIPVPLSIVPDPSSDTVMIYLEKRF